VSRSHFAVKGHFAQPVTPLEIKVVVASCIVITVAMIMSPSFIAAMELDMISRVAKLAEGDLFA
jgi:hypothetical protein